MNNKRFLFPLMLVLALFSTQCNVLTDDAKPSFKVVPEDCELQPGEKIAFSLQGEQPPGNLKVEWVASAGAIIGLSDGVLAEFTAPPEPGPVTVSVIVTRDNDMPWRYDKDCEVVAPEPPPPTPTPPTGEPAAPSPAYTSTPLPTPTGQWARIIISEVMINVCGGDDFKRYNQYIELYNNGEAAVDVGSLWIYAPNSDYRGQRIVSWEQRNPDQRFAPGLVYDSTVIPPGGVAVILPPQYINAPKPYRQPYRFPAGTIILTVEEDIRLGDHFYGMRADDLYHDVVILYQGGRLAMEGMPISTYGTPRIGSKYLRDVYDDGADALPLIPAECSSVERIDPNAPDNVHNWHYVRMGSPGEYIP